MSEQLGNAVAKGRGRFRLLGKRWSLRIRIMTAFTSLLTATVISIMAYTYYANSFAVLDLSRSLLDQVTDTVIEKITHYLLPASTMAEISAQLAGQRPFPALDDKQFESHAVSTLKAYPQLAMFSLGDERGNFIMAKKQADGRVDTKIISRQEKTPVVTWKRRDASGKVVRIESSRKLDFDPRTRPWYVGAKKTGGLFWTDVYVLFTDRKPGITASYPVTDAQGKLLGVIGLDIELGDLSSFLRTLKIGNSGLAFIVNEKNEVVAHAYPDLSKIIKQEDEVLRPVKVDELGLGPVSAAFRQRAATGNDRFAFNVQGERFIASFTDFPASLGSNWVIVVIAPEDDFIGFMKRSNWVALLISLVILLLGVFLASLQARSISRPIRQLAQQVKQIRDFRLDQKVGVESKVAEVHLMSSSLGYMHRGLKAFEKYVPSALVRQLIQTGEEARLGGTSRELTIFFSDIENFTNIAEESPPEDLLVHLSEYLDQLTTIIRGCHGTIDKYIGDAIMAFWGAPAPDDQHALHACQAALACQHRLLEMNQQWVETGRTSLVTRMGIHTGESIVGNLGSKDRMNYTAIGDSANLASRLEGINKHYGTNIIISEATCKLVADNFIFRPLDIVAVKGKQKSVCIYELVAGLDDESSDTMRDRSQQFSGGFDLYLKREWEKAGRIFAALLDADPSDHVSWLYVQRCRELLASPPGPEWTGVTFYKTK